MKQIFEACEDDCAVTLPIIVDDAEFDFTIDFFEHGGLDEGLVSEAYSWRGTSGEERAMVGREQESRLPLTLSGKGTLWAIFAGRYRGSFGGRSCSEVAVTSSWLAVPGRSVAEPRTTSSFRPRSGRTVSPRSSGTGTVPLEPRIRFASTVALASSSAVRLSGGVGCRRSAVEKREPGLSMWVECGAGMPSEYDMIDLAHVNFRLAGNVSSL